MRSAPLLMCLVDAELARRELAAAQDAARALREAAATAGRAHLRALADGLISRENVWIDAGAAIAQLTSGPADQPHATQP